MTLLSEVLFSGSFDGQMKDLTSKIDELNALVKAKGGIDNISKLTIAAKSKAKIADDAMTAAKDKAEIVIKEANTKAEDILSSADERAERISVISDAKIKEADNKEASLNKLEVELNKAQSQLSRDKEDIQKRELELEAREAEVSRKLSILDEL